MNWIKGKLRAWLFPEYDEVYQFMQEIREAKLEVLGKNVTFNEPIVLVGNLTDCKVNIKPTVNPEIFLSKIDFESLLRIMGNQHLVTNSTFIATKTIVK